MKARDVRIITFFEIGRIVRSAQGILFFCFFALVYGWIGSKLYEINSEMNQMLGATPNIQAPEAQVALSLFLELVGWLTGLEASALQDLMTKAPPVLVAFSFCAMVFAPLLSIFGSFDQTAGDMSNKHIRYLLIRTDRTSLYVGKTLGAFLVLTLANLLLGLVLFGLSLAGGAPLGAALFHSLRIAAMLSIFALPFVSLMGLANAMTGHNALSLLVALAYYFIVWVFSSIGSWINPKFEYVSYLFPTALKYQLMSDQLGDIAAALGQQFACTAAFFALGLFIFRRRDV